jgi:glycine cleavage system pyridoxal-binding protein P
MVNAELLKEKIVGPLSLGSLYPELTKTALVCVTETTPRTEIERLTTALRRALEKPL